MQPKVGRFLLMVPRPIPEEYERLKDSIATNGVRLPILCLPDGEIIDGHTRFQIANELGIECPYTIEEDESRAFELSMTLNLARRHLTDVQKVMLGMRMESSLQRLMAKSERLVTQGDSDGRVRDRVASMVGLGTGKTYSTHRRAINKLLDMAPSIKEHLDGGHLTMQEVRRFLDTAPFLLPLLELGALDVSQMKVACEVFQSHYDSYPNLIDAMLNPSSGLLLDPHAVKTFVSELDMGGMEELEDVDLIQSVLIGDVALEDAPDLLRKARLERHKDSQLELVLMACRTLSSVDISTLGIAPLAQSGIIRQAIEVLTIADPTQGDSHE